MKVVIGVDEAGRGCMWGSVFAGAVVLPDRLLRDDDITANERFLLRDSKLLSEKRRKEAAEFIYKHAIAWGVGESTATEIDTFNILRATHTAMHRAIDECIHRLRVTDPSVEIELLLIDGNSFRSYDDIPHECVIGGDASHRAISAASILAKTSRDAFVTNYIREYPMVDIQWKLGKHKGYCTKDHMDALRQYGIHSLHRKSYSPVRNIMNLNLNTTDHLV